MSHFGTVVNVSTKANISVIKGRKGGSRTKIRKGSLHTNGWRSGSGTNGPGNSSGKNGLFVTMSEVEGSRSKMKKRCEPHSKYKQ